MKHQSINCKSTYGKSPVKDIATMIIQLRQEKKTQLERKNEKGLRLQDSKEQKYNKLLDIGYETDTEEEQITNKKGDYEEKKIMDEDHRIEIEESDKKYKAQQENEGINEKSTEENDEKQENDGANIQEDEKNTEEGMLKENAIAIGNLLEQDNPFDIMEKLYNISKTRK
ncbi:hypothetical protein SAMN05660297_00396 [Natronincola peptidivorans]|uniref:Uncharacterized protein n=1 Tax=Natronincola peptidivorans TaxID=426128 RepID=A0A1H9YTF7_9FIRM|nr:hypothetical protein [Natronincola peptidivorans]SES72368.1 hypothetical protein SAMN05660297_00396 [Natronincola peptidivorans]